MNTSEPTECHHEHCEDVRREKPTARWILPSDERYEEDGVNQETYVVVDHEVWCLDCGQCVDVNFGD